MTTQAAQTVEPVLAGRQQQLHREGEGQPLWVEGDPARLTQILVNLLTNAAKYTDAGGQVWLKVGRDGDRAVLRMHDSGIGIDAEILPHIFELFTQAEWSKERSQGGLGVGLALVRRLVELHNGTITAHSPAATRAASSFCNCRWRRRESKKGRGTRDEGREKTEETEGLLSSLAPRPSPLAPFCV